MHFLLIFLTSIIPQALAEEVPVQLLSEDIGIEQMIEESVSHASADVSGKGASIQLTYSTDASLSVFIAFLDENSSFSPFETLQTTLAAGVKQEATINLTQSPGWKTSEQTYRLYFLSSEKSGAQFDDIEFIEASLLTTVMASFMQLSTVQPYSPASYHRLPGYKMLGFPIYPLLGAVMLVAIVVIISKKRADIIIPFIVTIALLSHARFSVDAVRYSVDHLSEWIHNRTFATAGSLPDIGMQLQEGTRVYLCHTGTTYAQKILQYHSFPARITKENPTHVLVHKSTQWSIDGAILTCGTDRFTVSETEQFTDGSILYHIES